MTDDSIRSAAEFWYGYGRWNAPYWFIGPEPGMKRPSPRLQPLEMAYTNVAYEAAVKRSFTSTAYTADVATIDKMLLAFKSERTDNDAIGDYQCNAWGTLTGETCAPELSALAARGFSVERDRLSFRKRRTEHLRLRVVDNAPRFVLMYGGGVKLQPFWDYIACGSHGDSPYGVESIAGWQVGFGVDGPTQFVRTAHPVGAGKASPPDDYWLEIAGRLRSALGS